MTLAIQVDEVTEVLLADGWHTVLHQSFAIDAYEFLYGEQVPHGGGEGGISSQGFRFLETGTGVGLNISIAGPLTSILAVRHN
jgi:hypothetical protein